MDEELDLDELMALQAEEEQRVDEDDELQLLREWEDSQAREEAKENSKLIKETEKSTAKRIRTTTEPSPLDEIDTVINIDDTTPDLLKSPNAKRQRRVSSNDDASIIKSSHDRNKVEKSKVYCRIPDGNYLNITAESGERFYVKLRHDEQSEEDVLVKEKPSKSGLCDLPFPVLFNLALREGSSESGDPQSTEDQANDIHMSDVSEMTSDNKACEETLWVEKFRPKSYLQLLSDDGTNRMLLYWLKLWDLVVFNRPKKVKAKPKVSDQTATSKESNKNKRFNKTVNELPRVEEYDSSKRPMQKVALLHGPPGLGKTTLAHVIANHAGYNVVEINASDDRSLAAFKTKVESATQMRSVNSKDQRPNCLIIDEIDGAPTPTINFLVSLINGKPSKGNTGSTLLRPIICICNDLYVPSLRPLKQHAMILPFPPTLPGRLSQRLMDISRKERLSTDMTALLALCEKTDNDIRACLSTLQFFKSKGKELRSSDVQKANIGQKDVQKSQFSVWKEIFQIPRGTVKKWKNVQGRPVQVEESASAPETRYSTVLKTAQSCGDYDKLVGGVFENYLDNKFKDSYLENVISGHEWFRFFDILWQEISHSQIYTLMGYAPFVLVSSHFHFSSLNKPSVSYPFTQAEKRGILSKNRNILSSVVAQMAPIERAFGSELTLVLSTLPFLMDIIQPNLRPVNTQLYSAREKEELLNVVRVMQSYNLTYRQERSQEGQYNYRLDPSIEDIIHFPDVKHKSLSYSLKQLIAHEVEVEKMRSDNSHRPVTREESKKEKKQESQQTVDGKPKEQQPPLKENNKSVPSHLHKLQAKEIDVKQDKSPVDFFGRKIEVKTVATAAKNDSNSSAIVSSDIWFKFKEGYNNAVRKHIKMKDFI